MEYSVPRRLVSAPLRSRQVSLAGYGNQKAYAPVWHVGCFDAPVEVASDAAAQSIGRADFNVMLAAEKLRKAASLTTLTTGEIMPG